MTVTEQLHAVLIYAALLALVFVALSVATIFGRRRRSVALGDGGSEALLRRIRAHGNFSEYVPLALFLLAGSAALDLSLWMIHILGVALLGGRVMHAAAIYLADSRLRVAGMALTLGAIVTASVSILATFLD